MPYGILNSSVLRRMQKQECDADKSRTSAGSEFQAAGPDTAKLRDPYRESRERGILRSPREHDRGHERSVESFVTSVD